MANIPKTFPQIIEIGAARYGATPALITQSRQITYSQLCRHCEKLAHELRRRGLKKGERVAVVLPNEWHFVASVLAVIVAEAIVVPLDPAIRPKNFLQIVRDCEVSGLIVDETAVARLAPALEEWKKWQIILVRGRSDPLSGLPGHLIASLDAIFTEEKAAQFNIPETIRPESIVSITYTSGSTGKPKGVMHSHCSWLSGAAFTGVHLGISPGDKILLPLPLHHAYSFRHVLAYLLQGATVVIAGDIFEALKRIKAERPQAILLVPAACNIILQHFKEWIADCAPFLDFISVGTAPLPAQQYSQLQACLPDTTIHLPYGLTEARVGFLRAGPNALARGLFAIQPGMDVRVVDEVGRPVLPGETGEIVLKGEGLMAGYWPAQKAAQQKLQTWGFATGDLGCVDEQGAIALLGRGDDIINVGGRKVAPQEVEAILAGHPHVVEAAVLGTADPNGVTDQQITAVIVLENGAGTSEEELIAYSKQRLEPYKVPAAILFRDSLHKSALGKIKKRALVETLG